MMSKRDNDASPSGRRIPARVVLAAVIAVASLPLFVAAAVGALGGSAEPGTDDHFNTNRQEIGRGDSAFGRYIMYTSTGPDGTCVDIELPEVGPPRGGRLFYSDCSGAADPPVNSAKIVDEDRTIVYGLVPEQTAAVELDRGTGRDLPATLHAGQRGEGTKFFIVSTSGPDVQATVRAVGPDDREIAAKSLHRAEPEPSTASP